MDKIVKIIVPRNLLVATKCFGGNKVSKIKLPDNTEFPDCFILLNNNFITKSKKYMIISFSNKHDVRVIKRDFSTNVNAEIIVNIFNTVSIPELPQPKQPQQLPKPKKEKPEKELNPLEEKPPRLLKDRYIIYGVHIFGKESPKKIFGFWASKALTELLPVYGDLIKVRTKYGSSIIYVTDVKKYELGGFKPTQLARHKYRGTKFADYIYIGSLVC